ncbi:hypothetical protein K432DRAFT_409087 [Lepidopterella palustris CBS 459.81]|uniref:Uncharacterized protein n=1 Tax=Lepidopterella palustris CBS 459.81 TaxID=1314670 RepID=A0A8E2E104_9PEZI|nr:hypothetical protein K432DRAFT_409087 [Lepidopterella palustris CBS 459.81]
MFDPEVQSMVTCPGCGLGFVPNLPMLDDPLQAMEESGLDLIRKIQAQEDSELFGDRVMPMDKTIQKPHQPAQGLDEGVGVTEPPILGNSLPKDPAAVTAWRQAEEARNFEKLQGSEEIEIFHNFHVILSVGLEWPVRGAQKVVAMEDTMELGAQMFFRNIVDRYPRVPEWLARRLANTNWSHAQRLGPLKPPNVIIFKTRDTENDVKVILKAPENLSEQPIDSNAVKYSSLGKVSIQEINDQDMIETSRKTSEQPHEGFRIGPFHASDTQNTFLFGL